MRHRKKFRKFGRTHQPRMALLKNLATSLVFYEKIKTTEAKAKEVRPIVEKWITLGKKKNLHSRRQLLSQMFHNEVAVSKVLEVLVPKYEDQKGGYLRIHKLGNRSGDNAPMCLISFV